MRVQCEDGYAPLNGSTSYVCSRDGTWFPHTPECEGLFTACNKDSVLCYINGAMYAISFSPLY